MGVLGLAPFVQKVCPQIIRRLPNRLQDLTGKTIVFDGTLITQRLHFAPAPHRYRHVLGWYRLLREFRDSDVQAICVFDGKERSVGKQLETERRRQLGKTNAARANLETERLQRLKGLKRLLSACRHMESTQREWAALTLRKLIADVRDSATASSLQAQWAPIEPVNRTQRQVLYEDVTLTELIDDAEIDEVLMHQTPVHTTFNEHSNYHSNYACTDPETESICGVNYPGDLFRGILADSASRRSRKIDDQNLDSHLIENEDAENAWLSDFLVTAGQPEPTITTDTIPDSLAALYLDYRRSIPTLHSLTTAAIPALMDVIEVQTEYAMSKSQHQLMLDEGKLWRGLAESDTGLSESGEDYRNLVSLAERSRLVSQSYERRCNPPTAETYEESKLILGAMGVPCVETSGPFEAEALASSMVLQGHADYVATEDTDVLVYEAPMIRNITSRKDPLVVLSGADIRSSLALDRPSYIDFVLLLGTDFSQRIKNIGPNRALQFIREHGSIERVIERETRYPPRSDPQTYLQQVKVARLAFMTLPPVPNRERLAQKEWDQAQVRSILERFGLLRATAAYLDNDWDSGQALSGNYFSDSPVVF